MKLVPLACLFASACSHPGAARAARAAPPERNLSPVVEALVRRHGEAQRGRIERGLRQVSLLWREKEDGEAEALRELAERWFVSDPAQLDLMFSRFEYALEQVDGYFLDLGRELRRWNELEIGPQIPLDDAFAALDLSAHSSDDFFRSKIAFVALLNFPLPDLSEMLANGKSWTRRQWAEARLTRRFALRPSAQAQQARAAASSAAQAYVAGYNVWMHHVLGRGGERPFPPGMRLISHWNLRDEIKAEYADPNALPKQRLLRSVMERIVAQTIPKSVIDDPRVDWTPETNAVTLSPPGEVETAQMKAQGTRPAEPSVSQEREPDTRYAMILADFRAARLTDADSPLAPTEIDRRFEFDREIPEARVRELLESIVSSPLAARVGALVQKRLGRPLEPHDLWYSGFLPRAKHPEEELSRLTRHRYPTADAYKKDIPRLLTALGFAPDRARFFDSHIVVDPARGAGHALQSARRGDDPHLRTRINPGGMDYKGYNIAVHEMGHNVEQICSLYLVDHTLLQGVPNTAFTEALAFTFQNRDLELLGVEPKPDPRSERLRVLNDFWATWEIAGVGLVDRAMWRWMYAHPQATPAELREATLHIARELWDRAYAPILGGKGSALLAVYSHMVSEFLYLPDYPLGHIIAFQLEHKLRGPEFGAQFERAASYGRVAPDLWMEHATGSPVSAQPLLAATEAALASELRE
jgi:hypothetical protein